MRDDNNDDFDYLIKSATATHALARRSTARLLKGCRSKYGYEPGDVDAEHLIEAIMNGREISAKTFDEQMRAAVARSRSNS